LITQSNMVMELASEQDTIRFIQTLWFSYGMRLVKDICKAYNLDEEQRDALQEQLLKPNDWDVIIKSPLKLGTD
jgi:hypothetical protein